MHKVRFGCSVKSPLLQIASQPASELCWIHISLCKGDFIPLTPCRTPACPMGLLQSKQLMSHQSGQSRVRIWPRLPMPVPSPSQDQHASWTALPPSSPTSKYIHPLLPPAPGWHKFTLSQRRAGTWPNAHLCTGPAYS